MSRDPFSRAFALASADLALPRDVRAAAGDLPPARKILLTGATGFLGAATLDRLLQRTEFEIFCLVRGAGAMARVEDALAAAGARNSDGDRIRIVQGDLSLPGLGLSRQDRAALASEIDVVFHLGAEVNWAKSYDALRAVNVSSTVELARLCCEVRPKPLVFVSTLAGCYAHGAPAKVDESTDMVPFLEGMPLAYAQAKCVAESLLRSAAGQGLPVTVLRSGLICADSRTGRSNPGDIVSRLLCSAARQGKAPDVDWAVDACPVDYVAEVIVSLAAAGHSGFRVMHLDHPEPRHWREVIAWLNVAGYPVSLVPYEEWLDLVSRTTQGSDPALFPLRPFFLARPRILGGGSLPELYFEANRRRIDSTQTRAALEASGLRPPRIDGVQLAQSAAALRASGHLAVAPRPSSAPRPAPDVRTALVAILGEYFQAPGLELSALERQEVEGGIVGELFGWKLGAHVGVARYQLTYRCSPGAAPEKLTLILKRKPTHDVLFEVGEAVASACGNSLAGAFRSHAHALEFRHAQVREAAIYRLDKPSLRRHMPRSFGTAVEQGGALVSLAIECLDASAIVDPLARRSWPADWVRRAILGVAEIHSSFLGDGGVLARESWHVPPPDARTAAELRPLWEALAEHAAPFFSEWWGEASLPLQRRLIEGAPRELAAAANLPRTLIHNDFNPRNIAFRGDGEAGRLCAFDWELATLDLPQRDLAELLCFVLAEDAPRELVWEYVELHRVELERLSGRPLDREAWIRGFEVSLHQLLLSRLPLYVVYHRIRRQDFLPRVLANWRRLSRWVDQPAGR